MTGNLKKLRPYDRPPRPRRSLVPRAPDSAAIGFLVVGALWFVAATGIGALWGAEQVAPQFLTFKFPIPVLNQPFEISAATTQAGFLNALVFGWLTNGGIGAILFATPRLMGRPLAGEGLAFLGLLVWNLAVGAGLLTVYLPSLAASGTLAEFPLPVDAAALLGLLIVNAVFFRTVLARGGRPGYVSLWYFGVGLLALLGLYAAQSAVAVLPLPDGVRELANAFYARALMLYWVFGAAFGALLYVVPRTTGNPLFSGGLALLGFGLWLLLAGGAAIGALVDPSVPYAITSLGNTATILFVVPVFLVVANLLLTIQGRWSLALGAGALALAVVSVAFLIGSAVLDAVGGLRSVQAYVARTEWPLGNFVYAALGFATFALFAAADHALPRALRRAWGGSPLTDLQLWTAFGGAAIAGLALIGAGLVHASLNVARAAGAENDLTLLAFRIVAAGGLGLAALGGIGLVGNLFLMYTTARPVAYGPTDGHAPLLTTSQGDEPGSAGGVPALPAPP